MILAVLGPTQIVFLLVLGIVVVPFLLLIRAIIRWLNRH